MEVLVGESTKPSKTPISVDRVEENIWFEKGFLLIPSLVLSVYC